MPQGGQSRGGMAPDAPLQSEAGRDAFFHAVVENAADMISVVDATGALIYSSPVSQKVFGVKSDEAKSLREDLFHPDDYPFVLQEFTQLVEQGGSRQLSDHRLRGGNGAWMWVQTHAINLIDDPRVCGIVMVSRDITVQKKREEETLRAEMAVNFGHWRWDKNTPGPDWSDGMFSMLGLNRHSTPADMLWAMDLIHADDQEAVVQEVTQALVSGVSFNRVISMRHKDGDYRRVMLMGHVERDNSGAPTSIVGICQDITELQAANDAIRQSEMEFRLLAEHSTDAIVRYSKEGRILYISPSVERILGFTPEECVGHHTSRFIHPDDVKHVTEEADGLSRDGGIQHISFRAKTKSGSYVWLESAMSPVFDADRQFEGFVACTRDITEQKTREQELMDARERAEQASLTKSRFLANMSHELRTPLNAILGFSEMMTTQVFGPLGAPQYQEYAGHIHESGSHLLALIGDILDMSKIEAGKYDLTLEDVSLGSILEKAARMVQTRIGEGELELLMEVETPQACCVYADERALTQIVLNLLSNAVKFTPIGGRITISAKEVGLERVAFSISDTGVGIEPGDLERIQHPFEQVVKHAELASQGTGLGLPLVRALTELQSGTFNIESIPGRGTMVNIELPRALGATSSNIAKVTPSAVY